MGKRAVAAAVAVLVGCGAVSSCHAGAGATQTTEPAAQTSDTAAAAEARAVEALHTWLNDPQSGTLTISSIATDTAQKLETSRQLTGRLDPSVSGELTTTASLTGTVSQLGNGATTQDPLNVIVMDDKLYWSIPSNEQSFYPGRKWFVNDLSAAQAKDSTHSIWWAALEALDKVHMDGLSVVDTRTATEFTGTVDLATIPSVAAQLTKSPIIETAGSTKVSVDIYAEVGTGTLVRVTYRLGLQVSVDATPSANSTAGYEVDLSGFGAPVSPTATPVVPPAPTLVASGGVGDLSQLILF
jgi:hypothetical protein